MVVPLITVYNLGEVKVLPNIKAMFAIDASKNTLFLVVLIPKYPPFS